MSKSIIMKKNLTKASDNEPENSKNLSLNTKNYVTPTGFAALQDELRHLASIERPKVVEVVRWAAGNGDRSENGDYIYGKKRLRDIDRRIRYLTKRLQNAEVVDPRLQQNLTHVFFGATVKYVQDDGVEMTVKIVGIDEANLTEGKISWISPVAKALLKSAVKDKVWLHTPEGKTGIVILEISY